MRNEKIWFFGYRQIILSLSGVSPFPSSLSRCCCSAKITINNTQHTRFIISRKLLSV